mgnify:CR=1 FL=1
MYKRQEEEEEDEDIFADIDSLLEELAEAFDAVEDEWFDLSLIHI